MTELSDGLTVVSDVVSVASYCAYRWPSVTQFPPERAAPLATAVQDENAVAPDIVELFDDLTLIETLVFAVVVVAYERVDQVGVVFVSITAEVKVPEAGYEVVV